MEQETIDRIVELDIDLEGYEDENFDEYGVDVVSIVDSPAIGVDFLSFNSEEVRSEKTSQTFAFSFDDDKRIATGPLMIPNKMILRRDEEGNPYYIYFTKTTVEKMAEKFLKLNKHNNTDVEHSFDITTQNTLLESWISEDKMYDKAYKMGFALPMGTWYVSYKINDDETWRRIKEGELKGFSLAGPFIEKMASNKLSEQTLANIISILESVDE